MNFVAPSLPTLGQLPDVPVMDRETLDQLKEIDDGGLGLTKEMFDIFQDDTPPRLAAIAEGIESKDLAKIRDVAHALKGSCGSIGALHVQALSAMLEAHGRGLAVEAPLAELMDRLRGAYDEFRAALQGHIDSGHTASDHIDSGHIDSDQ